MSLISAALCLKSAPKGGPVPIFSLGRFEEWFEWSTGRDRLDRSHYFGIFWIEQGAGEVQGDPLRFPFGPGSLIFVSPGQLNVWKQSTPVRGDVALFTEDYLSLGSVGPGLLEKMPFLYEFSQDPSLRLEGSARDAMGRLFADLRRETESAELGQDDLVRARLTLILGQARRLFATLGRHAAGAPQSPLASRFRLALAQHFPRVCHAIEYARILQVSRRQLNDELQRQLGRTASELIRDRTVLEAKRLLVHTPLTISEIGFEQRFEDPSYFVRFFHRLTGITPGRYRAVAKTGAAAG